jgi:hypothetical protein
MRIQTSVQLMALVVFVCLVTSGCQKPQPANPEAKQADSETASADNAAESAAAPEEKPIDPKLVVKPGEPMTAERYQAVIPNLKQLGLSFHNMHEAFLYFLPTPEEHPEYYDENGRLKVSWRVHMLPFLDQMSLYQQFKLDEAWDSPNNASLAKQMPATFRSPDTPAGSTRTRFRIFQGKREKDSEGDEKLTSMFPLGKPARIRDTEDGTSNTIMVVEVGPDKAVEWTKPGGLSLSQPKEELGATGSTVAVLKGDGSISLIKKDLEEGQWQELVGPQDGTVIPWETIEVQP